MVRCYYCRKRFNPRERLYFMRNIWTEEVIVVCAYCKRDMPTETYQQVFTVTVCRLRMLE